MSAPDGTSLPGVVIGVDVGGTTARAARVDALGRIAARRAFPSHAEGMSVPADAAFERFMSRLVGAIRELRGDGAGATESCVVGIAVPGPVDATTGAVRRCTNLSFLNERTPGAVIAARTGAEVVLMTDIGAAGRAEQAAIGAGSASFGHLRFGTGIGYVEFDGPTPVELLRDGDAHLDVLRAGRAFTQRCACGLSGCLEAYLPSSRQDEESANWTAETAAAFDSVVFRLRRRLGGQGVLVIGGGRAVGDRRLAQRIEGLAAEGETPGVARVRRAECGDDAGVLGAASAACGMVERRRARS
ncbi:MAG: hypothetical protein FLDDKLPJ_03473 [Phycisphaerae bacterium]|nr:hypothetical protein [Phycisphaerae bacterium]